MPLNCMLLNVNFMCFSCPPPPTNTKILHLEKSGIVAAEPEFDGETSQFGFPGPSLVPEL